MGQAQVSKARICQDCRQTLYGTARDLREHAALCERLKRLNLVVPGLLTGQDAVTALRKMDRRARRF